MADWLSGWSYRKAITISGSSGAGSNYQVLFKVGESSGASGYDFHVEGHSAIFPSDKNDSGDIRFTAPDGTTLYSIWVEKVEGSSPNRTAYIWVKVADSLDSNLTIYCYYGNSSATNVSDGESTFNLFDDFDGSTIDSNKWNSGSGGGAVVELDGNGNLHLKGNNSGSKTYAWVASVASLNIPARVRFKTYVDDDYYPWIQKLGLVTANSGFTYDNKPYPIVGFGFSDGGYSSSDLDLVCIEGSCSYNSISSPNQTEYLLEEHIQDGHVEIIKNDSTTEHSGSDSISETSGYMHFGAYQYASKCCAEEHIDWVFVGKYIYPEPAFSSAGSEETPAHAYTKTLTETITLSDSIKKLPSKKLKESISLTDTFSRQWSIIRYLTESISLSDALKKDIKKYLRDSITLNDYVSKGMSRKLFESLTLSDSLSHVWHIYRKLYESLNLSDRLSKHPSKQLRESISLNDAFSRVWGAHKTLTEAITLSDRLSKSPAKMLKESISLKDHLAWLYPYYNPEIPLEKLINTARLFDKLGIPLEEALDDPYLVYLMRYMAKKERGEL